MRRALWILVLCFVIGCCSYQSTENKQSRTPQRDLLSSETYKTLIIEVMYVASVASPTQADLDYLKTKLQKYCRKTNIVIAVDTPIPVSKVFTRFWDTATLTMFENLCAVYQTTGDTLVVRILYIPGVYASDIVVRGLAYGDRACCLFITAMTQSHERAVLLHELGHIMGLVNCGTPNIRDHEEPQKGHKLHCKNEGKCVMYWCSPEVQDPEFCSECQLDIAANGGKRVKRW